MAAETILSSMTEAEKAAQLAAVNAATGQTAPLPRSAYYDPVTGAERPLNNPVTNPQNYQTDLATGQANAVINRQIDVIAKDPNLSAEQKQVQMKALTQQKTAPIGITPEMRAQYGQEQFLPQNLPTPIPRDYTAEQEAAAKLGIDNPQPDDLPDLYEMTYGNQLKSMIESGSVEASVFSAQKLAELGITPERVKQLMDMETDPAAKDRIKNLYDTLLQYGAEGQQAASVLGATPKPTNEMMGVLSEALNAKSNFKNQRLGTSDLFSMAGLSGYEVLAQSLRQRGAEMDQKYQSASAAIRNAGGSMASAYDAIASQYENIKKQYGEQMDRLLKIDETARDHEFILQKMEMEQQNKLEIERVKQQATDRTTAAEARAMYDRSVDIYGVSGTVAGTPLNDPKWKNVFDIGGIGGWCGEYASTISTAPKVGNSWAEKRTKITHQANPTSGDKLLIPIGVRTDAGTGLGEYGHVATVLSYDPITDQVVVVESNRDGRQNSGDAKGIITMGTYNLSELRSQYGDDWGFAAGDLRPEYQEKLNKYIMPKAELTVEMVQGAKQALATAPMAGLQYFSKVQSGETNMLQDISNLKTGAIDAVTGAEKAVWESDKSFADKYYELATALGRKTDARNIRVPSSNLSKDLQEMDKASRDQILQDMIKELTTAQQAEAAKTGSSSSDNLRALQEYAASLKK